MAMRVGGTILSRIRTAHPSTSFRFFAIPAGLQTFPVSGRTYSRNFSLTRILSRLVDVLRHGVPVAVPHDFVFIVERRGKYLRTLNPGSHHRIAPFVDNVAHFYRLEDVSYRYNLLMCTTKDKVLIATSFILYYKYVDPVLASYEVNSPDDATRQHAKRELQSEIGKITLDKLLTDRDIFIANLLISINATTTGWGVKCVRFEIMDISFPRVRAARKAQVYSGGESDANGNTAEEMKIYT